ncbi:MAG: hypothetical protein D6685_18910 [Bacteroidetes bacterium]|nr:MAG: hypothetical protein D6685_18910 [Bacteroidota bacterium]
MVEQAAPEPEPVDPAAQPPLERLGKNTTAIPARVVGRQGRALVVRLHAVGYENERFVLGGVNAADFEEGSWILVDVAGMTKKKRVHQVSFNSRLS